MEEKSQFNQIDLVIDALKRKGIVIDGRRIEFIDREEIVNCREVHRTYVHIEKSDGTQGPEYLLEKLLLNNN